MPAFDPMADPGPENSPVLGPRGSALSAVARPERPLGMMIGLAGVAVVGLLVFSQLSHHRQARALPPAQSLSAAPNQAPLSPIMATFTPVESQLSQPNLNMPLPAPMEAPSSPALNPNDRLKAPAMVVDLGEDTAPAGVGAVAGSAASGPAPVARTGGAVDTSLSADERFGARVGSSEVETASATRLRDTALIAPQGTVIPAVMETAINLDLPGFARAVVSRDVRGFDGSTVLIPRGSRLIGQYRAGVAAGQSRAFVVWSRVLTPEGVSVDIASPGADRLGRSGLPGETNTHFFRRFGNSILLSILSAGIQSAAGPTGDTTSVVIGSQQQASNMATIALQKEIDIPDTVTVAQGAPIRVFVTRDLDFSGVMGARR